MSLKQEHKEFAKAVISLAREHKVGSVEMKFRFSVCTQGSGHEDITITWEGGCPVYKSHILLSANYYETFSEEKQAT